VQKLLWSVICGLTLTAIGLWYCFWGPGKASIGTPIASQVATISQIIPAVPTFGSISQPTTVLFMGVDVMYEGRGHDLKSDHTALNGRSDTMMLAFFNPQQNKISVLNIPRDTEVAIGKYGVQKINSANALGGPEYARAAVTSLVEMPVEHYVVMNLQGLVQLVNELGGVTVEVPKKMSYMDWTAKLKIDLEPGVHTLTGNQAMGFVRFRHDELGDIGRVQRQQIFLHAAAGKMMDPRSWLHVPALLEIAQKNIQTDLSEVDLASILNFAHNVPKANIKFVMLPGQFAANGNWIADPSVKTVAFHMANPEQEYVSSRRNISICIVNASSDPTFGGKLATALRKLGYITSVGKDDKNPISPRTRIIVQNGNVADAKMLQQDLGGVGELLNASVGNLYATMTLVARDDLALDKITMSSVDAPYIAPPPRPVAVSKMVLKRSSRNSETDPELEVLKAADEAPVTTKSPTASDISPDVTEVTPVPAHTEREDRTTTVEPYRSPTTDLAPAAIPVPIQAPEPATQMPPAAPQRAPKEDSPGVNESKSTNGTNQQ
jgi:LCP family protein required for cell wall assembly